MSKNKNLLNENTIRRMMKLASVDALSDSFISTKYTPLAESVEEENLEENVEETVDESVEEGMHGGNKGDKSKTHKGEKDDTTKKDDELKDNEGGRGEKKGDKAFVNEEEAEEEMEDAMDSMDDAEDKMDTAMDAMDDAEEAEDEVTLSDDEARDIIALADKLRAAMGGEEESAPEGEEMSMDMGDDEMEMDAEVEEEPGMRYDMMEEEEENLYEAALSNLNIEVIEEKEVQLENLKKEIYKKVVNRLLKESKK